jgi:hypothetical protein
VGIRFRRSVRIAPGVRLNVTKTGLGITVGPRGAHYSVHSSGRRTKSVGIPGTGLYYQEVEGGSRKAKKPAPAPAVPAGTRATTASAGSHTAGKVIAAIAILGGAFYVLGGGGSASSTPASSGAAASPPAMGLLGVGASAAPVPFSSTEPVSNPTAVPQATAKPQATARPTATAKPKATPRPTARPAALSLSLSVSSPVARNAYASATARTAAGARCSIVVEYASGPSQAAGLGSKTASSSGQARWSWRVGSSTGLGSWPVTVTCSKGGASKSVTRSFTVVH